MTDTELEIIKATIAEDMLKGYNTLDTMRHEALSRGDEATFERLTAKAKTLDEVYFRHLPRIVGAETEDDLFSLAAFILAEHKVLGTDRSGTALAVDYILRVL